MYSRSQLKKAVAEPRRLWWELNRLYYRRLGTRPHNTDGIDLFAADWDNLLILDACRYDTFAEHSTLPGTLTSRTSRGSATSEWIRANFHGQTLHDTVYVSASPMLYRNRDTVDVEFHAVVDIWKEAGWDETYRTVLPETVTEAARQAAARYPDKRLLVHYLQPHYPFLGPTGREHFAGDRLNFQWMDLTTGTLTTDPELVRTAYRENLDVVLPHVEELLSDLRGKTVVTSDHGQMLGERGFPIPVPGYGHPPGVYNESLTRVPWHEYTNGKRKRIVADEPTFERDTVDDSVVTERLEQLGYVG
ncbi:hypothetical protein SAMN04487949_2271 [Halogranum gelatinilyticum]|uniref:Sulfatase n=1 Tax=Halogranum gelatinilyticum TaxID=660521 RepID=A0A1G9UNT5_9EURY|nr:hypothetical protein [Halogranum gelatinilyticum]SDM61612.1 hypothetical protein SAMN04487949_2271 [Halogranum gelatinilyticum]